MATREEQFNEELNDVIRKSREQGLSPGFFAGTLLGRALASADAIGPGPMARDAWIELCGAMYDRMRQAQSGG